MTKKTNKEKQSIKKLQLATRITELARYEISLLRLAKSIENQRIKLEEKIK